MPARSTRTSRELAQGLVEYGLIIAFMALLCIGALLLFHPWLPSVLTRMSTSV